MLNIGEKNHANYNLTRGTIFVWAHIGIKIQISGILILLVEKNDANYNFTRHKNIRHFDVKCWWENSCKLGVVTFAAP